jgi:uncharacterized membrane protein YuzA (DUF378 family)
MSFKEVSVSIDLISINLGIISIATLGSLFGMIAAITTIVYNVVRFVTWLKTRKNKTNV